MPDRLFYSLAGLVAVLLIALASVYPQGIGARSPKPFGHETWAVQQARAAAIAAKLKPVKEAPKLRGPF